MAGPNQIFCSSRGLEVEVAEAEVEVEVAAMDKRWGPLKWPVTAMD
jgi:hypothetical protein